MTDYLKGNYKSESALEKATLIALTKHGALCYKFASPSKRGVPDDIILLPNGVAVFIEFKHPNGRGVLSKLQKHQIDKIDQQNFTVFIVDSITEANRVIGECISMGDSYE